jgi:hypothetical protein
MNLPESNAGNITLEMLQDAFAISAHHPYWRGRGCEREQEEFLEARERLLSSARMASYRCDQLFHALLGYGLSIDLAEDIAQKVWEIPLNYFTSDYARRKPQWDAFMRGI